MSAFRGSDETLDREIETLRAIARVRLRRYAREQVALDQELRALLRERGRRRSAVGSTGTESSAATGEA